MEGRLTLFVKRGGVGGLPSLDGECLAALLLAGMHGLSVTCLPCEDGALPHLPVLRCDAADRFFPCWCLAEGLAEAASSRPPDARLSPEQQRRVFELSSLARSVLGTGQNFFWWADEKNAAVAASNEWGQLPWIFWANAMQERKAAFSFQEDNNAAFSALLRLCDCLEAQLGEHSFLMGEEACSADAVTAGNLAAIIFASSAPNRHWAQSIATLHPRIVRYTANVLSRFGGINESDLSFPPPRTLDSAAMQAGDKLGEKKRMHTVAMVANTVVGGAVTIGFLLILLQAYKNK